ncbi:restriction endonuclease subunit S [Cetobacterium sp. 2G large]|uniref:restriction endonuclease subunit S n=1 Tax=Cetobacterium sp. 2G large TaxID=2759680 RepID=UPI00163C67E6|nr:restriction endonuclease subunit S [Cetobacterium sp. 2G large]MBC2852430.1 restriction endonuclease subunit S [Cetobacterium sp. 2G large]
MKYRYREPHEMKDSGVEWLGMIPKDWEVKKIKRLVREVKGGVWGEDARKDSNDVPCIRITNFNRTKNIIDIEDLTIRNLDYLKQKDFLLQNGDLLIEKSGGGERQPVGFTCIYNSDLKAIYANFIARVRVKKNIYSPYINFLFSVLYSKKINLRAFNQTTGIQNLSIDKYFDEIVMIPLFSTQQKIADFLDKKCEEFDSVIAKKEMLINKLEEAKKSLISEVVTGKVKVIEKENGEYGIIRREDHEMKDSGVEWLGMIPKEWQVSKMKNKLIKFTDGAHISPEVENGVYPFLSVKDLKNGFLDFKNCLKTSIESYKYLKRNSCKPERGDLLISKDGTIGKTCLIDFDKEFVVASSLVIIKSNKNFSIKFLDYILQSEASQKQIFQYVKGAALPRISLELLKNIYIPFINQQDEQIKINNLLDKKCSQFDIAIEKQKEIIEKLKSAKQSLISEVVTGKIEVL